MTDQEKEEDYELNLYINTFVSEETPVEGTGRIQIIIKPLVGARTLRIISFGNFAAVGKRSYGSK